MESNFFMFVASSGLYSFNTQKCFGNDEVWTHDLLRHNPLPQPLEHYAPHYNGK